MCILMHEDGLGLDEAAAARSARDWRPVKTELVEMGLRSCSSGRENA
jgi:hypothetical protein